MSFQLNIDPDYMNSILIPEGEFNGLYGPVGNNNPNEVYGVLPYVAPEILKGGLATKA
ncbi:15863_t:CDS:2 [Funneliformis geosporum]|nr:15863_t:CDS:2 [Funneliformis geosporum]